MAAPYKFNRGPGRQGRPIAKGGHEARPYKKSQQIPGEKFMQPAKKIQPIQLRGKPFQKSELKDSLIDNLFWLAGTCLYAVAVMMFALPNEIAQSGMTGVSIVLNRLIHSPVGLTTLLLNAPLLLLAWRYVGRKFVLRTLWVTAMLSVVLDVFGTFVPAYEGDRLLAALYCGVISGIGLGLVLYRGATTGGMDIVVRLVRLKWPHITMGRILLVADALVIALSALVFRSLESALYAIISIYISTRLIDYILYGTGGGKMLLVVSERAEALAEAIRSGMRRGVTVLPVQGGYTKTQKHMLLCAVRSSEVVKLTKLIWAQEENPFIIVADVGEILGEGFKRPEEK